MILAIVVDTEADAGICYELADAAPTVPPRGGMVLEIVERMGDFPLSGHMVAAMLGIPVPLPAAEARRPIAPTNPI